jgi:hypothetical protein
MDELFVCMFSFCMNLMYVIRCRLCFISYYVFFYNLNVDCVVYPIVAGELDVNTPVATIDSSSDGRMMSARPLLGGVIVVTDVFCPSILSYHCNDALVAMDRLPVAIVTYGLLVQSPVVVVKIWA